MAELNFETVHAEIEALDLDQLEREVDDVRKKEGKMAPANIFPVICKVWNTIGKIVKLVVKFPLLPSSWKRALKLLIKTMDGIC